MKIKTSKKQISDFIKIHGDRYDYSKVLYKGFHEKFCIICPIHGDFWQTPANHFQGKSCPKCKFIKIGNERRKTTQEFISESIKVHNNVYRYNTTNYINAKTKVCIICPEHGEFWQLPFNHLKGKGCPKCNRSKGEIMISHILNDNNIFFLIEKQFDGLTGEGGQSLRFDFYLPDYLMCIEYDGIQHFDKHNGLHSTETAFNKLQNHDMKKTKYCKENAINLIRIRYNDDINLKLSTLIM